MKTGIKTRCTTSLSLSLGGGEILDASQSAASDIQYGRPVGPQNSQKTRNFGFTGGWISHSKDSGRRGSVSTVEGRGGRVGARRSSRVRVRSAWRLSRPTPRATTLPDHIRLVIDISQLIIHFAPPPCCNWRAAAAGGDADLRAQRT